MSSEVLFIGGPWDGKKIEVPESKLSVFVLVNGTQLNFECRRREYVLDGKAVCFFHPANLNNAAVIKLVNANLRTIHQMIGTR